jgi:hypothetical protein
MSERALWHLLWHGLLTVPPRPTEGLLFLQAS